MVVLRAGDASCTTDSQAIRVLALAEALSTNRWMLRSVHTGAFFSAPLEMVISLA